ncbi:MAG: hypothetical protein ABI866_04730, partial [Dokdonella sp.]
PVPRIRRRVCFGVVMYNPGRFPTFSVAMIFDAGKPHKICGCCRHSPISNSSSRATSDPVAKRSADEDGVPERMNQAIVRSRTRAVAKIRIGSGCCIP